MKFKLHKGNPKFPKDGERRVISDTSGAITIAITNRKNLKNKFILQVNEQSLSFR